jgi:hypothetical protein
MQMQSPAFRAEFEGTTNEVTESESSAPNVLNRTFVVGLIHGLFLSVIFWILLVEAYGLLDDCWLALRGRWHNTISHNSRLSRLRCDVDQAGLESASKQLRIEWFHVHSDLERVRSAA